MDFRAVASRMDREFDVLFLLDFSVGRLVGLVGTVTGRPFCWTVCVVLLFIPTPPIDCCKTLVDID